MEVNSGSADKPGMKMLTRVMLVDDSVVVRGLLRQIIEKDPALQVVATAINGKNAIEQYQKNRPDVVLMDIEMPEMTGIEALKHILAIDPDAKIIMCSSLTQSGAAMTMTALQLGAIDCLAKPTSSTVEKGGSFESQLLIKLRGLGKKVDEQTAENAKKSKIPAFGHVDDKAPIVLRPYPSSISRPQVLAIGSSTGGPKALTDVLSSINKNMDIPILITQHMPPGFTKLLAENLEKHAGIPAHEGANEMLIKPGNIYVAPGGKHMTIEKRTSGKFIVLDDGPMVNHCKPAVDVMFRSILKAYGNNILSLILTGMGEDGMNSAREIVDADPKNILVAQDRESSVVWGMPGAAARAGICHSVLPLGQIPGALNQLINGRIPTER